MGCRIKSNHQTGLLQLSLFYVLRCATRSILVLGEGECICVCSFPSGSPFPLGHSFLLERRERDRIRSLSLKKRAFPCRHPRIGCLLWGKTSLGRGVRGLAAAATFRHRQRLHGLVLCGRLHKVLQPASCLQAFSPLFRNGIAHILLLPFLQ